MLSLRGCGAALCVHLLLSNTVYTEAMKGETGIVSPVVPNFGRPVRHERASQPQLIVARLAQSSPRATLNELNDEAWKALAAGRADRAATLFAEALEIRPDESVLLFGAGAAAHAQGKPQEALARLRQAIDRNPRLVEAARLLGAIAYDQGDLPLAIRTYENALKYAPQNRAIHDQLQAWREEQTAHSGFEERRSDRFRVMFEGRAEEALAADATTILSSAFWRIGETLGVYPSDTVVAILYTEKQFRDITRAPDWSGGQYDGRIRIPVAGATQQPALFQRVLTHELTHAILSRVAPRGVPSWLNEGLAQYFDGSSADQARRRMRSSPRRLPLTSLERGFGHLNGADAQVAYDESLLAIGLMLERPGFGWTRLLRALDGSPTPERVLDSFGLSYADLEAPFSR
jgi:tetratricopeptide (TPR) repeat protein